MRRRLVAWTFVVLFVPQIYPQEHSAVLTTQISPSLSIVREINPANPYAGQQFSIIYSLYAFQFPVAVDIEPQQYSHFWTEIIPLTAQTRTITRIINGRPRHEFLLRQVVAYPLSTGILELPPLALKIKMTGSLAAGSENWDLIAQSKADFIRVRPLPPQLQSVSGTPFTGSMSGQWSEIQTGAGHEVQLQLRGNANLAFFRPQDWVRSRGGFYHSPRLVDAESEIQTRDLGGNRQLAVVHSQRWSIRVFPSGQGPVQMEDLVIPLFEPESATWSAVRMPGFPLRASSAGVDHVGEKVQSVDEPHFLARYMPWVFGLGAVGALILWRVRKIWVGKEGSRFQSWANRQLAILRKQAGKAPRSFIETAHRVLERYSDEQNLRLRHENTAFQQCWSRVERNRFVAEDPSLEEQARLLEDIQALLNTHPSRDPGGRLKAEL
jgi:hypothetical protein